MSEVVYYENLTKDEYKVLNILKQYDKQFNDNNHVKFLFMIKKGSYDKPKSEEFHTWLKDDFKFSEGDVKVISSIINNYPSNSLVVEVGVWKGWSTTNILKNLNKDYKYVCVDWFKGSPTESCEGANPKVVRELFEKRLKENDLLHKVEIIENESTLASKGFENNSIDVLFLDGAHTEPYFTNDVIAWSPKIKVNGIFCGHDWSAVGRTAKELFTEENGYERISLLKEKFGEHDCWAYKKVK
jgi:hypothetical protein